MKFINQIKQLLRRTGLVSKYENELLTINFQETVRRIKEKNSRIVFNAYYMPRAASAILKEQGYLATDNTVFQRASTMMFMDLSNGTLTEFYKFRG